MKIAVCYKNVPDSEKIRVAADNALDFSAAPPQIGQYDLNAVEAAVQIAVQRPGAEVIALTAAGAVIDNSKQRKAILSRGVDKMIGIKGEDLDSAETYEVAFALASAVKELGDIDLVICGEGSADMYSQQTGVTLGAILGWSNVNAVASIGFDGDGLIVRRDTENSSELIRVQFPAVLSVTSDINRPRIPSMKDILAAGKKQVEVLDAVELGHCGRRAVAAMELRANVQKERRRQIYEAVSDEALDAVAQELRKLM